MCHLHKIEIILNKTSQTQKGKYHVLSLICGLYLPQCIISIYKCYETEGDCVEGKDLNGGRSKRKEERQNSMFSSFLVYVEFRFNYTNVYLHTVIYSKKKKSLSDDLLSIARISMQHIASFLEWPSVLMLRDAINSHYFFQQPFIKHLLCTRYSTR